MKQIRWIILLNLVALDAMAQNDVVIGSAYQFNLQLKTANATAYMLHNAKIDASGNFTWQTTHGSFGSRGIQMDYYQGISFYANSVATVANATLTPALRFFIHNNGFVGVGNSVTPLGRFTILESGTGWNDGLRIEKDVSNYVTVTQDGADGKLKNWGAGGLRFFTSAVEAVTVLNNGKVGFGKTTPGYQVDVNGIVNCTGVYVNGQPFVSGGSAWTLGGTSMYYNSGSVGIGNNAPAYPLDVTGIINCTGLYVNGAPYSPGGSAWALTGSNMYYNSGNVGIGTTAPDAKLAVSGQVHAQEVKVSTTVPGPDYVFEKAYPLLDLKELESYIDKNHHLPEVPSAKEMSEQGIKLGEMNLTLLKKVEELTLYVLELKKENERQNAIIESLSRNK